MYWTHLMIQKAHFHGFMMTCTLNERTNHTIDVVTNRYMYLKMLQSQQEDSWHIWQTIVKGTKTASSAFFCFKIWRQCVLLAISSWTAYWCHVASPPLLPVRSPSWALGQAPSYWITAGIPSYICTIMSFLLITHSSHPHQVFQPECWILWWSSLCQSLYEALLISLLQPLLVSCYQWSFGQCWWDAVW